jgi:TonB family protein
MKTPNQALQRWLSLVSLDPIKQPHRLYCVLLCLSVHLSALGDSPTTSKGITADGRVIIARYGTPPPWAADIIKEVRPHMSASDRAMHHQGEGFFRVILDSDAGTVRRVLVVKSSGYAGIDQSVIDALRQWKLRPRKWKQFEIHVGLWFRSR